MPKIIPSLSVAAIKNAKPDRSRVIDLRDGKVSGLQLRIMPSGNRSWCLSIRNMAGQRRRYTVECDGSLADARAKASAMISSIKGGNEPVQKRAAARQRARDAAVGRGTLGAILAVYAKDRDAGARLKSWSEQERRIRGVFASLMDKPALELAAKDYRFCVDEYPARVSAAAAVRYIRPVLKWAEDREYTLPGVAAALRPPKGAVAKRDRALDHSELHAVLRALGNGPQDLCARFLLLTATRREEAAGATWGEFDLDRADPLWTLPPERRKNTRGKPLPPHVIPLPAQATALLREIGPGEPGELVFGNLDNWDRWQKRIFEKSGTTGWTRHDLRRTAATLAGELGTPPHVVETMLGHTNVHSQLASVYNRSRYSREHAIALQSVADELDRIANGEQVSVTNVTPMRKVRADA